MSASPSIRVLIVDDSAVSRRVLADLVAEERDIEVVASVSNGQAAVAEARRLNPDVVLMDVLMPVMDGLDATCELMREAPCRIILVSDLVGRKSDLNFRALEAGALDLMRKPSHDELRGGQARAALVRKIRTYAQVPVVRRHRRGRECAAGHVIDDAAPRRSSRATRGSRGATLVCIGASTGGPPAIRSVLKSLDGGCDAAILIAQHMTEGFIQGMAHWLDESLNHLRVRVAVDGEQPARGQAYLAPDSGHLQLTGGVLRILDCLPGASYRPSVDALFQSVARSPGAGECVAILLTGMGEDGARGLLALRGAGAHTIAQDEASSTIYGMPRAACALNAACETLPLAHIGQRVQGLASTARAL